MKNHRMHRHQHFVSSQLLFLIDEENSIDVATTCRSNEFSCRDGSCIPYYDVCNSYEDCPSGIDEAMCSPGI
jgi:hypothetical protein